MGIFDIFKKKQDKGIDEVTNLTLRSLKNGYMVDYDLKTWEVKASNIYDWGEGDRTREWQLASHDDIIYLELEVDDEEYWGISRKIPLSRLGAGLSEHIQKHDDPPEEITYEGVTYTLDESGGGHFHENGTGPGRQMLKWDFLDDSGKKFVSIEQWGEREFEAAVGETVQEYQFTNILPAM
jgi:hypothetical protein